jgi:hypothetical protein
MCTARARTVTVATLMLTPRILGGIINEYHYAA